MMEYKRLTTSENRHRPYALECFKCFNKECNRCDIDYAVWERLAELEDKIEQGTLKEQKTCKNITEMHPVDEFTCSECGITLVDFVRQITDEDYETTYHEYEIKYCPNCGAKVVEEL